MSSDTAADQASLPAEPIYQLVRVKPHEDPGQCEPLGVKDSLIQMSKHREHRRASRVLVRVVPVTNVTIEKSETDYCDAVTGDHLQHDSALRRTVLTPIVNDFHFVYRKHSFFFG